MTQAHYQANFTKAPLLLPESRIVADLLLKEVTPEQWREAIQIDNVLQKRSPTTAVTQAGLIRNRLQTMQRGLWQIIRDSANPDAVQALFAATIKYSPLIADFLDQAVRQELRRLSDTLRPALWDRFIDDCELRDSAVAGWSASTREKLRQNA
jgi:hypothetical protein